MEKNHRQLRHDPYQTEVVEKSGELIFTLKMSKRSRQTEKQETPINCEALCKHRRVILLLCMLFNKLYPPNVLYLKPLLIWYSTPLSMIYKKQISKDTKQVSHFTMELMNS